MDKRFKESQKRFREIGIDLVDPGVSREIPDVDKYCGYCKCSPCRCDGHGRTKGSIGTCGYCGSAYFEGAGIDCDCDGFGGDPVTHEKACRYCSGIAIGHFCTECGMAQ